MQHFKNISNHLLFEAFGVVLYYLVVYPDIQRRLQDEIDEIFDGKSEDEELEADDITNMTYLDQVLSEGQRLGCFAHTLRICTKNWQGPGDSFVIPKGTKIYIPTVG